MWLEDMDDYQKKREQYPVKPTHTSENSNFHLLSLSECPRLFGSVKQALVIHQVACETIMVVDK